MEEEKGNEVEITGVGDERALGRGRGLARAVMRAQREAGTVVTADGGPPGTRKTSPLH